MRMLAVLILLNVCRLLIIIIIIIFVLNYYVLIICFPPTSTMPVGLKISYNMVCRLRWSALGKKLRLGESVAEGDCIASL